MLISLIELAETIAESFDASDGTVGGCAVLGIFVPSVSRRSFLKLASRDRPPNLGLSCTLIKLINELKKNSAARLIFNLPVS